jgi:hypothetical protein
MNRRCECGNESFDFYGFDGEKLAGPVLGAIPHCTECGKELPRHALGSVIDLGDGKYVAETYDTKKVH